MRIGFGYDVHQLQEGKDLWLGGIKLQHSKGAVGHSDADVLIHAICDALLGAANLGDIGYHFPNTSAEFKNIDSKILLKRVVELLSEKGYSIGNIDSTLTLEAPKINPHIPEMKKVLSKTMDITEDQISIKATTNETMGFVGREEGVCASAVALIFPVTKPL
jgi:2-C-methyl-D-erythritol 2,4-cyclodiphosphate synthase